MKNRITAVITASVLWAVTLVAPLMTGCNSVSVAQQIVNWAPTIVSTADLVATSVSTLAPQDAAIIAASVAGFDAGANLISSGAAAYLANPNQNTLQALETQVTTFQQNVTTALLQAARIVDPASQQKMLLGIQAVAVGVNAVLALLVSIKGSTVTPASAAAVKLAQVELLMDRQLTVRMVANHYQEPEFIASAQVAYARHELEQAGF
jgi:hypothetical protein